jgi:hypothetical protein
MLTATWFCPLGPYAGPGPIIGPTMWLHVGSVLFFIKLFYDDNVVVL